MTSPLLSLRDVSITYLDGFEPTAAPVSFDAVAGDVILLTGPSGCGKSTLALTLNGLVPNDVPATLGGDVIVNGTNTREASVSELSRSVAMVFQDPDAQIVTATVLDEVCFALENLTLPADEVLARAESALRQVGLWERRADNPDLLSGGGRQRLAIACALAMQTPVIVLDEPTANLDPEGVLDVYDALAALCADRSRVIVLVEHNAHAAERLATQVIEVAPMPERTARDPLLRKKLPQQTEAASGSGSEAQLREAADAPVVSVRSLALDRGGHRVIDDANLEVFPGDLVAIVGPNGAGKTTLAHAIAGVSRVPRGHVFLDGADVSRMSARELSSRIGFVFQNPEHQFIAATVREELAHGLQIRGVSGAETATRVDEMLARFGLTAAAERHPFLLSGGQKRRLSVGTALITGPEVLVLDEPTFGQDAARTDELIALFDELRAKGTAIVAITHDPALITHPDARIVEVRDGSVREGTANQWTPVPVRPEPAAYARRAVAGRPQRDPFANTDAPAWRWLHGLNPLAKFLAFLPAMLLLAFTRDPLTPALFLGIAYVILLTGAKFTRTAALVMFVILPLTAVALASGFSLWTSASIGDPTPLIDWGPIHLSHGQVSNGVATALRFSAIIALALIAGLTSTGPDIARASVQQLGVPYRVGYASLASYRFVPRFRHELDQIRSAHRVRGHHGGHGPFAALSRAFGAVVPLLAGGIRHAERVALAMDSRAFGAFDTRTERYSVPWRMRDWAFIALTVALSIAVFACRSLTAAA